MFAEAINKGKFVQISIIDASVFCEKIIKSNRELSSFLILVYQAFKLVNSFILKLRLFLEPDQRSAVDHKKDEIEEVEAKIVCVNILRYYISNDVLYLMFLNCSKHNISFGVDFKKYRSYMDKYCLFEHLDLNEFLSSDSYAILSSIHNSGNADIADRFLFLNNTENTKQIFKEIIKDYNNAFGDSVYIDNFR